MVDFSIYGLATAYYRITLHTVIMYINDKNDPRTTLVKYYFVFYRKFGLFSRHSKLAKEGL